MNQALPDVGIAPAAIIHRVLRPVQRNHPRLVTYGSNHGANGLASPTTINTSSAGDRWTSPVIGANAIGNFVEGNYSTWEGSNATEKAQIFTATQTPAKFGVFSGGYWYLDTNGDGSYTSADGGPLTFNVSGGTPVAGDWNGDGKTEIGMYKNGTWWLDTNEDGTLDAGDAVLSFGFSGARHSRRGRLDRRRQERGGHYSGGAGPRLRRPPPWDARTKPPWPIGPAPTGSQQIIAVAGDWNGVGKVLMGVYCQGVWFFELRQHGEYRAMATLQLTGAGTVFLIPVVGDWNNSGVDKLGVFSLGLVPCLRRQPQWDASTRTPRPTLAGPGIAGGGQLGLLPLSAPRFVARRHAAAIDRRGAPGFNWSPGAFSAAPPLPAACPCADGRSVSASIRGWSTSSICRALVRPGLDPWWGELWRSNFLGVILGKLLALFLASLYSKILNIWKVLSTKLGPCRAVSKTFPF